MKKRERFYAVLVILPFIVGSLFLASGLPVMDGQTRQSEIVDLGNGVVVEVGPDEILQSYSLSDILTEYSGTGDSLTGSEYGVRTDSFANEEMWYDNGPQTTTTANLSVPLGEDWEGHEVFFINASDTTLSIPTEKALDACYPSVERRRDISDYTSPLSLSKADKLLNWEPLISWRD